MFELDIQVEGLDDFIRDFQNYVNSIDRKFDRLLEKLAKDGVSVANHWYKLGEDTQDRSWSVEVIPTKRGCKIRAKGGAVFFLEFGAGMYAKSNEMNTRGLDTTPGSWSKLHTQEYYKYKSWHHKKKGEDKKTKYFGIVPVSGMNKARAEILQKIQVYANEIFMDESDFR